MSEVELTIKGDLQVLRLEPGDAIILKLLGPFRAVDVEQVHERLSARFPNNTVIIVDSSEVELSTLRSTA